MTTRLDTLLHELAEAADGKRHLPVIRPHDAEAICNLFYANIDRGTEARAKAVQASGKQVACGPGCSRCCDNLVGLHAGESQVVARWLARPEQDALRDRFLEKFAAWRAGLGDLVDRWIAASAAGDRETGSAIAQEAFRRGVGCAFLDDRGACSIYPARPTVCREHHAIGTNAGCEPDADVPVEQASFPPLDRYLEKIQPILLALHDAVSPDAPGARPLCQAIHDDLAALVAT